MLDGRRKPVQPMAGRLPDGNVQALQQFVNQSPWDPLPVRRRIAGRLSEAITTQVWVIHDVSFPKCGRSSAGVARQCCGALGKRTNCQVAVSVHAATDAASGPGPAVVSAPRREWTDEPGRCRRAGIRDGTVHQEKWRLALGPLDNVNEWGPRAPVVVADAGYGVSAPFRHGLEERGLSYVLAPNGKEVAPTSWTSRAPAAGLRRTGSTDAGPVPNGAAVSFSSRCRCRCRCPGRFADVAWRQGGRAARAARAKISRFAVLTLRTAGMQSLAATQAASDVRVGVGGAEHGRRDRPGLDGDRLVGRPVAEDPGTPAGAVGGAGPRPGPPPPPGGPRGGGGGGPRPPAPGRPTVGRWKRG
ncbi:transposase, partial [Streptomyces sp. NPDC053813]|uniref:IS701 family transposase n=1 Tax=Streptomyces sp. NPDC053813 TaxID=3365717 RepID=UPI0037D8F31A